MSDALKRSKFSTFANSRYVFVSACVLCADSGHSSNSTKGERLSAKMRSLPGSNEPYEASSPKEIGEKTFFLWLALPSVINYMI